MPAQVIAAKAVLVHVAGVLDRAFNGHPMLLLFFVMIMCPLCMNLLQVRQSLTFFQALMVPCWVYQLPH
jgi:hypothetical protein